MRAAKSSSPRSSSLPANAHSKRDGTHEGSRGVPGRFGAAARRRREDGGLVVGDAVVVRRPGGEAPAEGGGVQGLRRRGQGQGVTPPGVPVDQGPLRPPLVTHRTAAGHLTAATARSTGDPILCEVLSRYVNHAILTLVKPRFSIQILFFFFALRFFECFLVVMDARTSNNNMYAWVLLLRSCSR